MIELYDQPEFKGTKCVITGNCPSLDRYGIKEVRSCKVIRGVWKLWKGCDNNGDNYLLKEGEYTDLKALNDGKYTVSALAPSPVPDPAWSLECLPFTIQLYEKVNFEGPNFETTVDCPSLDRYGLKEVRSCKVLSGIWDLYEGPDYAEPSYQLKEGEYPNPGSWCASDPTAPALSVKRVTSYKIQLYEKVNFEGPNFETTVDCPSLDSYGLKEVRSCKVLSGIWDLYEGPDYAEPSYQLKEGEYPYPEPWGNGNNAPVLSVKRVTSYKIQLYEKVNFEGPNFETTVDCRSLDGCGLKEVRSCKVLSGVWDLYEGPDYIKPSYQLKEGDYPNPESWCASDPTAPALSVKRVTE